MSVTNGRRTPALLWAALWVAFSLLAVVSAQNSSSPSSQASSSAPSSSTPSLSLTTSSVTITTTLQSGSLSIPLTTVIPTVYNVTVTPNATSSTPTNTTSSSSSTPSATPIVLDTKIDPGFGVLGALLILTGLPSAFLGHKNRWSSYFIIGFYTFALVCLVLILRFGVMEEINPPSETLRGLFVLSCGIAGIAGGGFAIFFWKVTNYFVGAWGGFALALWIQCFRNGGLIWTIGYRWIMYIALSAIGFILCTIPKIHYHVLLVSTAFVGASAFMLGVDCYTTAGLKEFYLWNLGFRSIFTKFTSNGIKFPVSQTMEIELGLMGAVSLMGMAVQFQVFKVLRRKLKEIQVEQRRRNEEAEDRAAQTFVDVEREKEAWEREHPTLGKHGRMDSGLSGSPLINEKDSATHTPDERRSSGFTLVGSPRQRYQSGVSEFLAAPTPSEELNRSANKALQSPGALPVLDLGNDIESDVPQDYISIFDEPKGSKNVKDTRESTAAQLDELKRKEELLAEIQTIRKSIDVLKADTPAPSSSSDSRQLSLTSKHTLSLDYLGAPPPSHLRPPRQADPRGRVQSMELSSLFHSLDHSSPVDRPTSVPLQDEHWNSYIRDRKLLQPPSGITAPIATTPICPIPRIPVSPAVAEALIERQRLESIVSHNPLDRPTPEGLLGIPREQSSSRKDDSLEDVPLVLRAHTQHKKASSQGHIPVTILPPQKPVAAARPDSPERIRTRTFEELAERHREKMRELQEPLTRAEKEQADIRDAKGRWEKAMAMEKQQVAKRRAEKAAALNKEVGKRTKAAELEVSGRQSVTLADSNRVPSHSRSLSVDVLASVPAPASSKRMSMMKVEDWQKHQQDLEMGLRSVDDKASKHKSGVPFPDFQERPTDAMDHRCISVARDPPN
ncbi:predicted protein [Sparassis crispa]|uniref:TM7S3/TM198-like domain-containing protein n=1 Tax=Sparassis crispa TaxID=139825 RepID=A0A401G6M7_9APHY|nr:predicted protein [Sparassis crispa]GBE77820.1 predicted protein [Sparassis crispa]